MAPKHTTTGVLLSQEYCSANHHHNYVVAHTIYSFLLTPIVYKLKFLRKPCVIFLAATGKNSIAFGSADISSGILIICHMYMVTVMLWPGHPIVRTLRSQVEAPAQQPNWRISFSTSLKPYPAAPFSKKLSTVVPPNYAPYYDHAPSCCNRGVPPLATGLVSAPQSL